MKSLFAMLAVIFRLAAPYFRSEDRWRGGILLASVVSIELAVVGLTVLLNEWNRTFYDALQNRHWSVFIYQLEYFCVLAAIFVLLRVYQLYLNQWLQIRWRRWLTTHYLGRWLRGPNHYRMQLLGDAADNPDQRIADDIQMFISNTLSIGLGLLNSIVTLGSFVVILWSLSGTAPIRLFGISWMIPGYLVWAALLYSMLGTALTHFIGRPLIRLMFEQQRYEADFRFNLVRVRENSEQIALLGGEAAETDRLLDRFGRIVGNWFSIMTRQKSLTFFTAGFGQAAVVFPYIVVSPAYFAGKIQLGGLMQTASAFNSVQGALSFFVDAYTSLAQWRAIIDRLTGFEAAMARAETAAVGQPAVAISPQPGAEAIGIDKLAVRLPNGEPLVVAHDLEVSAGDKVLVTGPSGAGKSTLFRAMAGTWPFGSGSITVPKDATVMMLPQRPYFPVATLALALAYPSPPNSYGRDRLTEVLNAVGLPELTGRLDEEAHWNRMLSLGEQQRLGIARALLQRPDYLFLDEATASLDEPAESALYRLLHERLPASTVISIGHRATLRAFHDRQLVLMPEDGIHRVAEATLEQAAQ